MVEWLLIDPPLKQFVQEMVESGGDIAESAGISANNVPPTKASQEEDKIEAEEESQIAAATSKQLDSGESYFSSGNFIRVDQLDIEVGEALLCVIVCIMLRLYSHFL